MTEIEVNVERWPTQDVTALDFHRKDLVDAGLLERGELAERQKVLSPCRLEEQPKAVLLDDLVYRSLLQLVQAFEMGQRDRWLEPELRFPIGRQDVVMYSSLLPGEKE